MNLKMSFLAAVSVALFSVSANAEIIHESDFEAEPAVGFSLASATMGFNDAGGDMNGFSGNSNMVNDGLAHGISASNPNSGSFSYVNDLGATTDTGPGWGAAWCGQNTEGGSGGFASQEAAMEAGDGCYVDFSAGATFTATCQVATDSLDPLMGSGTAEIRLEFNDRISGAVNLLPRAISTQLGAADLTVAYQEITISYTLTQADLDLVASRVDADGVPTGDVLNSVAAVMAIEGGSHDPGVNGGLVHFDDFVFEVDDAHVIVVGDGHATALKGDVNLSGVVDFGDIAPFIAILQSNDFQAEADVDCGGTVGFEDIAPFIAILQAG